MISAFATAHLIVLLASTCVLFSSQQYPASGATGDDLSSIYYVYATVAMPWCLHAILLAWFHASEFILVAWYRPDQVNFSSFLLNHSKAYGVAQLMCVIEYVLEAYLFPRAKVMAGWGGGVTLANASFSLGCMLAIGGLAMRFVAIA